MTRARWRCSDDWRMVRAAAVRGRQTQDWQPSYQDETEEGREQRGSEQSRSESGQRQKRKRRSGSDVRKLRREREGDNT